MSKILEVKDLKISFRTTNGTLKAVRDISFNLERGKTLAIVGESGSGKSVTSKAILGILAGNSIIEGGEIIYDGKDLLKITEEEMCKIRGDRISMIFQDPLSSLNPIVKIGKQITEAMLLKNKGTRRSAREDFNSTLALLKESMISAAGGSDKEKIGELVTTFDKFNIEAIKLENDYNTARTAAEELVADIDEFIFMMEKKQKQDVKGRLKDFAAKLKTVRTPYLTKNYDSQLTTMSGELDRARASYQQIKGEGIQLSQEISELLAKLNTLLAELLAQPRPDFFRIGYYMLKNPGDDLSGRPVEEVNEMTLRYLEDNFMNEFIQLAEKGIAHSFNTSLEKKKALLPKLQKACEFYLGSFDKVSARKMLKEIADEVDASIDRLETSKDSIAYTFRTALDNAIDRYFTAIVKNPKEEARYAKQSKKRDALIARGKTVDWKVVPKVVYDLDELKANISAVVDNLILHYENHIAVADSVDFHARSIALVDYFKGKASQIVQHITKRMAKEKAIKLMTEVGIPEPRIRYYQYPFEFSGGMRQRIVIAIALAANPDILICDEPTTALDVTIQAQILELINKLKAERNLSVIFITHDLGVVANMADDIAVMYAGKVVEYGTADDIFYDPRHPYTWALLSSMPDLDTKEKLDAIPGTPPNMIYPPVGDAFAERNKYAMKIDFEQQPPKFEISPTHWAATWLLHPNAPKVEPPRIITDRIERMKKAGGID
ncbi:MAG: ATP-binding cassette domain-containing protein [Oscillospiraceae bacterium]|nr:ATP-binding cassette domain-containing protein [Oscillospiraceae bacterium]